MTAALPVSLAGRDLLRISDLVPAEAEAILDRAVELRAGPEAAAAPGRDARPLLLEALDADARVVLGRHGTARRCRRSR